MARKVRGSGAQQVGMPMEMGVEEEAGPVGLSVAPPVREADVLTLDGLTKAEKEEILEEARERFKRAFEAEQDNRREALDDLKFVRGGDGQWPDEVIRMRGLRPRVTNNRLPSFIKQVTNEVRKQRPSIQVSAGDSAAGPATANIIQGLIKAIWRNSRADISVDTACEQAATCSLGHWRVSTRYAPGEGFEQELTIERIENPLSVYSDTEAVMPDYSDAGWRFVTDWVLRDTFEATWGVEPTSFDDAQGLGDSRPLWYTEDSVRVAEYWRRRRTTKMIHKMPDGTIVEGDRKALVAAGRSPIASRELEVWKVEQFILTGDDVLAVAEWVGTYIPIVTVTGGEMNIDGKRHYLSLIRFAKEAQRLYNYYASTLAELMAMQPKAPYVGTVRMFEGLEGQWAKLNDSAVPYLTFNPDPTMPSGPQRQPTPEFPAAILQAMQWCVEDMKAAIGLFDASLGARSNETSGVAIRERKREGDNSVYHFVDNVGRAVEQTGRILVEAIPRVYDTPRVVQIINPDEEIEMVRVNQLFGPKDEGEQAKIDFTVGRYDVAVKVGPSFETQRQESVAGMLELYGVMPESAPLTADLFVKNMDWPDAERISKRLKTTLPPAIVASEEGEDIPPHVAMQLEQLQQQSQALQQQLEAAMGEIQKQKLGVEKAGQDKDRATIAKEIEIVRLMQEQVQLQGDIVKQQQAAANERERFANSQVEMATRTSQVVKDSTEKKPKGKRTFRASRQPDGSLLGEILDDVIPEGETLQ